MALLNLSVSSHRTSSFSRFITPCSPSGIACRRSVLVSRTGGAQAQYNSTAKQNKSLSAAAHAVQTETDPAKGWWKAYPELWEEVTSRDEFQKAIQDSDYELILVGALLFPHGPCDVEHSIPSHSVHWYARADWYATWCKGCERAFPELSRMATADSMQGRVKFVKVRIHSQPENRIKNL